jgi:hypothetical protein
MLYPWESEDEFNSLLQDFRDEYKPDGRSEQEAVRDLTYYTFAKWRVVGSAQLKFYRSNVSEELKSGKISWDDIMQHEAAVPAHARSALAAVTTLVDDLKATYEKIRNLPYWTDTSEGKELQDNLLMLRNDVNTLIEKTQKEVIEEVRGLWEMVQESANRFDKAYQIDEMEKQLDLQAKFDVSIEKALRRLLHIKISKRVDGVGDSTPRLVESPSIVPVDNSTEKSPAEVDENTNAEKGDKAGKPVAHAPPEYRGKPKAD